MVALYGDFHTFYWPKAKGLSLAKAAKNANHQTELRESIHGRFVTKLMLHCVGLCDVGVFRRK